MIGDNKSFSMGLESTRIAHASWNKEKVNSEKDHTVGGIIMIWRMLHKVCIKAKQRLNEQIEDVNNTYARAVADEKITALRSEYKQFLDENRKKYVDHVNMVFDEKTAQVDKLVSTTADPELISLIQTLSMRTEVSDREWQAVVARITAAHDYQATRLLSDVAVKFNRSFSVPFDPDRRIEDIEEARADLLGIAKILDTDDKDFGLKDMTIVGEYKEPTTLQKHYESLDTVVGVAVPAKTANLIERLKEASEIARTNGDNATANAINRFIYEKATLVEDRQVISAFYKEQAETLISKALNPDKSKSQDFNNLVNYFTPAGSDSKR